MIYKEEENKWYKDQIDRIESLKKEHVETKEILSSITQTLEKEILVTFPQIFLIVNFNSFLSAVLPLLEPLFTTQMRFNCEINPSNP